MINAFIFDMDGVIIDSEPLHLKAEAKYLEKIGIKEPDKFLEDFCAIRTSDMILEVIKCFNLDISHPEALSKIANEKMKIFSEQIITEIPGISKLLNYLKEQNFKIGLATSSDLEIIEIVFNKLGIKQYFDVVTNGNEVKKGKPAPDIFIKTAEKLKVDPLECLVLEDSMHGVNAAKKAGMTCIGFKNPNSGLQDLTNADHEVSDLTEVIEIITSM